MGGDKKRWGNHTPQLGLLEHVIRCFDVFLHLFRSLECTQNVERKKRCPTASRCIIVSASLYSCVFSSSLFLHPGTSHGWILGVPGMCVACAVPGSCKYLNREGVDSNLKHGTMSNTGSITADVSYVSSQTLSGHSSNLDEKSDHLDIKQHELNYVAVWVGGLFRVISILMSSDVLNRNTVNCLFVLCLHCWKEFDALLS